MGILGYPNITISNSSTASYTLPDLHQFLPDARRLRIDELPVDGGGASETDGRQSRQPREALAIHNGCQFACHFTAQGACGPSRQAIQGPIPAVGHSYSGYIPNPSPGGYCQGFIISRLGTTPVSFTSGTTNTTNGSNVNWNNTPVSSCSTAGTTSCIQLRADAVGYAVNQLLTTAATTETNDGISNQFQVGLYPFIQNLCTSNANSSNSCSVGLTTSLTGSTITNFAAQLANLLDTGQNATIGSGGTHFENALHSMNSFITSVGTGTSSTNRLALRIPYHRRLSGLPNAMGRQLVVTKLDRPTHSVPYQNSATYIPPNSVTSTDYCTTMKNRGITIAVLYIPYGTIADPNSSFANNEDGYANNNIPNIPGSASELRLAQFLLHREHADRHQERAADDVRAGREHGPHHTIGLPPKRSCTGDGPTPASARGGSWRSLQRVGDAIAAARRGVHGIGKRDPAAGKITEQRRIGITHLGKDQITR